jgi:CheY-like chemotaxis protein
MDIMLVECLKNDDRYKNIPIVFVSTDDDNDSILESKRAGGDLFLRKPIQTPILINELIALLTGANKVQAN